MMRQLSLADAAALTSAEVAGELGVTAGVGLDPAEVARRAADAGPNELRAAEHESVLGMLRDAATEPFVLLLALAGVLAVLVGEVRDGLLILVGLVPIVGADIVTEFRGERALEALRAASAPIARVRRGGSVEEIPAAGLVPGDIVLLRTGDLLPADLRVLRAESLLVDRSVLTGESVPEPARVEPDAPGASVTDRHAVAYSGTSVVGGRGEGIVVAIGQATEVGRIAGGLAGRPERRSPVQRELDRLVKILLVVAIGLIATTTLAGFLRGATLGETLIAGISAAIASIPEEPPVLLAVVLGLGAYRLLKRDVLVRRLNAEETLGAVDLILTDKTGTLTQNRLEVASLRTLTGGIEEPEARRAVLADALRAEADSWVIADGAAAGSFARSISRAAEAAGIALPPDPAHLEEAWPAADGTPYSRVIFRDGDRGTRELALGAPEMVLALDGEANPGTVSAWNVVVDSAAADGERLLLLSEREAPGGWVPRALLGFADTIRPGTRDALALARGAGIQTLVVTGDHPLTAAAIARAAGIARDRVITGDELAGWDDERLARELPGLDVVARALPEQKLRLVRAAQAAGRTVAVTGDGVNDAPALNNADVAVAMGSGTAVAKEAADLVLGDDSFDTLMFALREGRRIVANIQKGLVFLISTHVAFLGFILLQTLSGASLALLPIQILWMELFIDTSTAVAFERESEEPGTMTRPPRPRAQPLLTNGILARIALAGGFSAAAALVLAVIAGGDPEHGRWLAYTALVVGQVVRGYANRSLTVPVWRLPRNGALLAAAILVVVVQAAIPVVPALADAFRAAPLDAGDWALVAIVALAPAAFAHVLRYTGRAWVA
jgi:Ca2+-transporting ATPase